MRENVLSEIGGKFLREVQEIPPPPYLFDGLIRDESVTALVSEPHSLKSMLMLYMSLCLDYSKPLFGRYAPIRAGHHPFWWSADGPDWDMGRMATKLMIGMGLSKEERQLCTIAGRWTRGMRVTDHRFWNPNKPKDSWLWKWNEEHGISILFIDTKLAATMVDENNALQAEVVQEHFKSIRDTLGIAVMYSHHSSKPSNESPRSALYAGRGSSADPGAADFQVNLSRTDVNKSTKRLHFNWAKARGDFAPTLDYVDLMAFPSEERDPSGAPINGLRFVTSQQDRDEAILGVLKSGPAPRAAMMAVLPKEMNEKQQYDFIDNWLQIKRKDGLVETDGKGTWKLK